MIQQELVKAKTLSKMLGISGTSLKNWRREGLLIEGVHYFRHGYNLVLYSPDMIGHWMRTRKQPELHDRKIQEYLASLEPESPKGKRKAA
jgi:hypothetical protein